jgi:hypothetical protein
MLEQLGQFIKLAQSDDVKSLGEKASGFTDQVIQLLTEIRDEQIKTNAFLLKQELNNVR